MGAALSDFASQNAVLEKRLPEVLDFLKRLAAVNSFTANRAGVHSHASERSADGSKLPEFVVAASFLEMGAITVAAIRELVSE